MLKSLITATVILFLLVTGVWYFLIKEYDYNIHFETSVIPSEIYQKLLYYQFQEIDNIKINRLSPFDNIVQKGELNKEDVKLNWALSRINDTVTRVSVGITNTERSFYSRLKLLTGSSFLKEKSTSEIQQFKSALERDADLYFIEIEGSTISPGSTCACISLKNTVNNKAVDMVQNINSLSDYLMENELDMMAKPRIQVVDWNLSTNIIDYNFCFPIDPAASPKPTQEIFLTTIPEQNSIKAVYRGNYMYSHLAWVRLLDYAKKYDLEIEKKPLEIFNDNPEMGGDSRNWEAEIYLPLK